MLTALQKRSQLSVRVVRFLFCWGVHHVTVIETEDRCCSPLICEARMGEFGVMRDSLVCIKELQD